MLKKRKKKKERKKTSLPSGREIAGTAKSRPRTLGRFR
jgi:hypothetical protein